MDPKAIAILIPVLALAIPVCAIVFGSLIKLKRLALEEAKVRAGALGSETAEHELAVLRAEVDQMRGELSEVHERLDFTERLLARGDRPMLKPDGG